MGRQDAADRLRGRIGAAIFERVAGPQGPNRGGRSTRARASAGSPRTGRSARCTVIHRCSSAGSGPCCCSRCTRWPWPPWRSTRITAATRGADCSGLAISWLSPRSAGPMTPGRRSRGSVRSTSTSPAPHLTGGRMPPPTRTCSPGCTSPKRTASCAPTAGSASGPSIRPDAMVTSPTWPGSAPRSACRPAAHLGELADRIGQYRAELTATAQARDAARFLLLNPPLPAVARAPYGVLAGRGVAAARVGAPAASPAPASGDRDHAGPPGGPRHGPRHPLGHQRAAAGGSGRHDPSILVLL